MAIFLEMPIKFTLNVQARPKTRPILDVHPYRPRSQKIINLDDEGLVGNGEFPLQRPGRDAEDGNREIEIHILAICGRMIEGSLELEDEAHRSARRLATVGIYLLR